LIIRYNPLLNKFYSIIILFIETKVIRTQKTRVIKMSYVN
jgi:hypothetical protein